MTIVKAIALAALTGTLAFGPQAALASSHKDNPSTERGNSAAAKADKAAKSDARETAKAARETAKANRTDQQDAGTDEDGEVSDVGDDGDVNDEALTANGKLRAGPIVSALRSGNVTSETTDLNGTVTEIDLSELPGNSEVAVIKALESADLPDAQATIAASATANTEVQAALANVNDEDATYAFVNADGTLVVVVP